ncbi:hypothetical protein G5C51_40725 [Streptomyces sp. A7024]|uniref:Uncharacterized protein n=1 Tax=Streptomyces coryli TaxID=1128680 RepID=A0A6G4UEH0_9ACTN|nr:hypothetical protein [Streptomyces coryli]NGN70196.1 hypothetical protein [Streptomyces coryli]
MTATTHTAAATPAAQAADLPHEHWWAGPLAATLAGGPLLLWGSLTLFGPVLLLPLLLLVPAWLLPPRRGNRSTRITLCTIVAAAAALEVLFFVYMIVVWSAAT